MTEREDNLPIKLYRYRGLEPFEYVADIICNNRFHTARFDELNDAMEGLFEAGPLVERDFLQQIREAKRQTRICAFSRTPKCPVLWAHYADGFKGLCIEIEVSPSEARSWRVTDGDVRICIRNILFTSVEYSSLANTVHTMADVDDVCNMPNLLLERKGRDWALEEEVRAFSDDDFIHCGDGVRITRILLGVNMPPTMERVIRRITSTDVPVCKTKIHTWDEIELDETTPLGDDAWEVTG